MCERERKRETERECVRGRGLEGEGGAALVRAHPAERVKDKLTDLWGSWLLQNDFKNTLCEISMVPGERGLAGSPMEGFGHAQHARRRLFNQPVRVRPAG